MKRNEADGNEADGMDIDIDMQCLAGRTLRPAVWVCVSALAIDFEIWKIQ